MKQGFFTGRFVLILLIVFIIWSCEKQPPPQIIEYSKIVFLSNRDAEKRHFDIFSMNLDGSQQINLTPNLNTITSISKPLLSPDRRTILFLAFEGDRKVLQLMDINGGEPVILTDVDTDAPQAKFSPDGSKILFVSGAGKGRQIHLINNDGSNKQNLSSNEYDEFEPDFGPGGKKIVYVSHQNGKYFICTMNIDGSNQKMISDGLVNVRSPHYSPDGSRIVCSAFREKYADIYIMKGNGKKKHILFKSDTYNSEPQFSPDGKRILFLSNQRGMRYRDIMVIDPKTDKVISVTNNLNFINQSPCFSPDGKKIVFESITFNNAEIYLVDCDGQNLKNLSNHNKWDSSPAF